MKPLLSNARRVARLEPPALGGRPLDMVLDTDTYNEIDDQFALTYAMLSPDRLNLQAVYAAPFNNDRAKLPGRGMELSYNEILEVFGRMGQTPSGRVFRGSTRWFKDGGAVASDAVSDLIARAKARPADADPLYVVAIGAITNIASALTLAPEIIDKIVVVWLGGQPHYWHDTHEFNLGQDVPASRVVFDCGVPFVHVPCNNVAQKLRTTVSEMRQFVAGRGAIGDFLFERFAEYEAYETPKKMKWNAGRPIAYCKEIWDVATIAWLIDPSWCPSHLVTSPVLTDQVTYSVDTRRHLIRVVDDLNRDAIFGDLFTKLATADAAKEPQPATAATPIHL